MENNEGVVDLSGWIDFFGSAGVPPKVRRTYAEIFLEHRINPALLADLDKDHLRDMGITVVGDIISILKQCKKTRHELTDFSTPVVTSTTQSKVSSSDKCEPQSKVISSAAKTQQRHRAAPETEGYIIKMPKGTTAKTRKILAAIKQKNLAKTNSTIPSCSKQLSKPNIKPVSSFGDSDTDDTDHYRIIISKPTTSDVTPHGSVFDRLGANTTKSNMSSDSIPLNTTKRIINRLTNKTNIMPISLKDDNIVQQIQSNDFRITRQINNLPSSKRQSLKISTDFIRRESNSVFDRVSMPAVVQDNLELAHTTGHLDYKGVMKRPRIQSVEFTEPPHKMRQNIKLPYSKGILSQGSVPPIHVKERLGVRSSSLSSSSNTSRPIYSRLGRTSYPPN